MRAFAYLGDNTGLTVTQLGHKMYIDTLDTVVAPHLIADGTWEPWVTQFISSVVTEGMHFVDVGAHLGWYTMLAHRLVGDHGTVRAFEPNPRLHNLLNRTMSINGLPRSRRMLYECALGAEEFMGRLAVRPEWSGNGRLLATTAKGNAETEWGGPEEWVKTVEVRTLDDVIRCESETGGTTGVDFIKIDAEGAESAVLAGAQNILRTNRRVMLLVEHHDGKPLWTEIDTMKWLTEDLGFGLGVVEHDSRLRALTLSDLETLPDSEMLFLLRPR